MIKSNVKVIDPDLIPVAAHDEENLPVGEYFLNWDALYSLLAANRRVSANILYFFCRVSIDIDNRGFIKSAAGALFGSERLRKDGEKDRKAAADVAVAGFVISVGYFLISSLAVTGYWMFTEGLLHSAYRGIKSSLTAVGNSIIAVAVAIKNSFVSLAANMRSKLFVNKPSIKFDDSHKFDDSQDLPILGEVVAPPALAEVVAPPEVPGSITYSYNESKVMSNPQGQPQPYSPMPRNNGHQKSTYKHQ